MGYGDEIIATGLARGMREKGKLAAFGAANKIVWTEQSKEIFMNNPNIANPEQDKYTNLEWFNHYKGHRLYGEVKDGKWRFKNWVCPRGEFFFTEGEKQFAKMEKGKSDKPIVVIEPGVKLMGACAGPNKQWPQERYFQVNKYLTNLGYRVIQFAPPKRAKILPGIETIQTSFRNAVAVLNEAKLYIGPEGGLHHAAAAVGTPAVVIFGGFNSPKSTGYDFHENIAIGKPCGSIARCWHCKEIMESISVERVLVSAIKCLAR